MTAATAPEIAIEQDVPFGTGGGETLRCDVYRGPNAAGAAAVLLLRTRAAPHVPGTKNELAMLLASDGMVSIVPEVRVGARVTAKGFEPYAPEVWPAGIHDVKAAVRWTRAHAGELGVDARGIFLLGYSNGGIMALGAAARAGTPALEGDGGNDGVSSDVAGVIAFSTPTTLSTWGIPLIVGKDAPQAVIDEASATRNVHPGFPPTMLLHGTDDPMIPPAKSVEMHEALRAHNVPSELHLFAGQGHDLIGQPAFLPQLAGLISLFVERYRGR